MSETPEIKEYLGIKTAVNRISPHVKPCVERLMIWINSLPASQRDAIMQQLPHQVFTYVDTYGGVTEPSVRESQTRFALVERTQTDYIADKRTFGELGMEHHLFDIALHSFSTVEAASAFVEAHHHPIIFCKGRHGTAGEQVRCIMRADLAHMVLGDREIFQEAVIHPELYENRKMVFRGYVLIHDGAYYYNDRFFAVVHGVDYDPLSDAYEIQIKHAGYAQPDSLIKLIPGHFLSGYRRYLSSIAHVARRMEPLLRPIIDATDAHTYMLLGADIIPTADGGMKLIEVNNYPNLIHTQDINTEVNIPMIVGMMQRVMFNAADHHWHAVC